MTPRTIRHRTLREHDNNVRFMTKELKYHDIHLGDDCTEATVPEPQDDSYVPGLVNYINSHLDRQKLYSLVIFSPCERSHRRTPGPGKVHM